MTSSHSTRDPHCGYSPANCPYGDACADCRPSEWVCPKCGAVMPGPGMLCSGSFLDKDHPPNVQPRPRYQTSWPAPEDSDAS